MSTIQGLVISMHMNSVSYLLDHVTIKEEPPDPTYVKPTPLKLIHGGKKNKKCSFSAIANSVVGPPGIPYRLDM